MVHRLNDGDTTTARNGVEECPAELLRFFTRNQGRVLRVRGDPGAGKTLFGIQTLDVLRQYGGDVLYVSTRVDTETVYRNHLRETTGLTRSNVLDISQSPFEAAPSPDEELGTDRFDPETFLRWLQTVGEVSDPLTVVFDSWELIEQHLLSQAHDPEAVEPEELVTRLAALARRHGIRVILITEEPDRTRLDYVVDGVVELRVNHGTDGRPERTMLLEKLRGVRIASRTRSFTLSEETFRVFAPGNLPSPHGVTSTSEWQPTANSKSTFSTGIADLDSMLGGGYDRGSVVHLELGPDLSRDTWSLLCFATARNFLSHDMCVAVVPSPESSPGLSRRSLEPVLSDADFDTRCETFETHDPRQQVADADDETSTGSSLEDGLSSFDYETYLRRLATLREESDGPLLQIIGMDAAGDALEDAMSDHATHVALHNDLSILVTKPSNQRQVRADQVADVHLCLERRGQTVFLYGKNPVTPFLGFDTSDAEGTPNIGLLEMV